MSLVRYQAKRNFTRTPEPRGRPRKRSSVLPGGTFVVQKHAARRLHYDFRLEINGVLASWAVPKGFPTTRGDRRLAMKVEDHPLDYGNFEGVIPEGNYGAGTVLLWDRGTYQVEGPGAPQALAQGKLHLHLHGRKLQGDWTLVKMRGADEPGKEPWLLLKSGEDVPPISERLDNSSVLSGKTMEAIAESPRRTWRSSRPSESQQSHSAGIPRTKKVGPRKPIISPPSDHHQLAPALARLVRILPSEEPAFVPPMKALLVSYPPSGKDWLFEIKWDGYRALAVKTKGPVALWSRNARIITAEFPEIVEGLAAIPAASFVLDGEIVALDDHGRPSFQRLQQCKDRLGSDQCRNLYYYIFDLLNLQGHDAKTQPLSSRQHMLKLLLKGLADPIRFSQALRGEPSDLLEQAARNRLEGLVAKRADCPYEPGRRSNHWQKLKILQEQEFVVGGYTAPKGARDYFGAILVGYYRQGELRFASKAGTGFDEETLHRLYGRFQTLKTPRCPFVDLPATRKSGQGLSRAEMRRCTWVKPVLVAQIRFTEWTEDGGLRHPVFLGLRDDKTAKEVIAELPTHPSNSRKH